MTEIERLIVAASFAGSTHPWLEFNKRLDFALGKIQEAEQQKADDTSAEKPSIWERLPD